MYDFPASPAVGDVSNGYVYNGIGWAGGPNVAAPSPAEQFINIAGLGQTDITVPAWAKGVVIEGVIWPSAAAALGMVQVSIDGTTFYGGTNYSMSGPYHNFPSPYYGTQGSFAPPGLYLCYPHDNLNVPQLFRFDMNLEAQGAGLISSHSQGQNFGNTGGVLAFQMEWMGYLNVVLTSPRVQKLRIISSGGTFLTGSWVKIRWSGDAPLPAAGPWLPISGGTIAGNLNVVGVLSQNGIPVAPKPQSAAGVGQWVALAAGSGVACVLPAGGTWAWLMGGSNTGTGGITSAFGASISAGGATLAAGTANTYWQGFAWRIA